jgi:hypothetical protein
MSPQRLSLPSLTPRLGQPSTTFQNSCGLILMMGCVHASLIPTGDGGARIGQGLPGVGGGGAPSVHLQYTQLLPAWAR